MSGTCWAKNMRVYAAKQVCLGSICMPDVTVEYGNTT